MAKKPNPNIAKLREIGKNARPIGDNVVQMPPRPSDGGGGGGGVADIDELIDPKYPLIIAKRFQLRFFVNGTMLLMHYWRKIFWRWEKGRYKEYYEEDLIQDLYLFLAACKQRKKRGEGTEFHGVNTRSVANVTHSLIAHCKLDREKEAPCWIGEEKGRPEISRLVPAANGLVVVEREGTHLLPATPELFNLATSPIAYHADAADPARWLQFLDELFPRDEQTKQTLQEFMGYCLTGDTRYHKMLMVVGGPRSGKGTFARILTALVGDENVAATSLDALADRFGKEGLIGKTVAILPDARLGSTADGRKVTEMILKIVGADKVEVDRKHVTAWTGKLTARLVLLTNELPNLPDASTALSNRMLVVHIRESFLGKENINLAQELLAELPGIFRWAIDGLERLALRGHFEQPESGKKTLEQMKDTASPISSFVEDCCVLGDDKTADMQALHNQYKKWCELRGIRRAPDKSQFGRELLAAFPKIERSQPRGKDGKRKEVRVGISLQFDLE